MSENGTDTPESKENVVGNTQSIEKTEGREPKDPEGNTENQKSPPSAPIDLGDPNNHTPTSVINQGSKGRSG
ncbi:hypothetical protein PCHDK_000490400 [Plasmodium chabaudi adami]|uniref:Uncharacterized protein n=1 Tax=Plasmodium chabaudi adami TaxID=5826 RepID=A0A1D3L6T0_PLACE|nr:hypothetical protein PCHDK_000490400 [Plasmodium chabaudi adami]